jgi:glutamyl-tRNA reductase
LSEIKTNIEKTKIFLAGLNHKTAPVKLRERIAFSQEEILHALEVLSNKPGIREITILSTCNRIETLVVAQNKSEAIGNIKKFISELKQIPLELFEESLYVHEGDEAVRHIFRVAASLDSMVVGEPQILGQVKEAYYTSTQKKNFRGYIKQAYAQSLFCGKTYPYRDRHRG